MERIPAPPKCCLLLALSQLHLEALRGDKVVLLVALLVDVQLLNCCILCVLQLRRKAERKVTWLFTLMRIDLTRETAA